jgi:hypothetical protein
LSPSVFFGCRAYDLHDHSLWVFDGQNEDHIFYSSLFSLNFYCIAIPSIDFAGSSTQLVADVDCTTEGKALCEKQGIRGYPTIKWGDPSDLQDFQGGRSYDDLKKFADENLKPVCSPKNIDLCDDVKKAEILKFQAMSEADLDALIKIEEKKLEDAESDFKAAVEKLQAQYSALSAEKDAKIEAVKGSGLGLMKSVKSSGKPAGSDEL